MPSYLAYISLAVIVTAYLLGKAIYDLWYNPLRVYPGPKTWALSRLPLTWAILRAQPHRRILELHDKYGPIVRVAPDELSYSHPDAWNEVMGHRGPDVPENHKDHTTFPRMFSGSVISANPTDHARMRRALIPKFSNTTLKRQEDLIKKHIDLFIMRLNEKSNNGEQALNMVYWINCASFDIISDMLFGESFHCLDSATDHPIVSVIFNGIKLGTYMACLRKFRVFDALVDIIIPRRFQEDPSLLFPWTEKQLSKLVETNAQDSKNQDQVRREENYLTKREIVANATVLLVAGSETSATALSATLFYLTTNERELAKLAEEVRSYFKNESEITISGVQGLPYLNAVIEESLRLYPPGPSAFPRRIAKGGCSLLGQHVPEHTLVSIWHWPLYRNPDLFPSPNSFIPERWLNNDQLGDGAMKALRPFSHGARDCLGKSLAYVELRLLLTRIIFKFDMKLSNESTSWEQKSNVYLSWEKGPLMVHLFPHLK
ncbi:cytochrome P450 [Mariannaea sp. PMI_226]|nr:cytochrome P450 [Mariannaea sp. PMI_226]